MLRYHELPEKSVSVTLRDETGETFTVLAERQRQGLVKMTCECPRQSEAGWCKHCLAVFSDREIFENDGHREAFERIVGRSYLERSAYDLTAALKDFAAVYRHMKFDRPVDLDPGQLKNFANKANHASTAAERLALALEDFTHELRGHHVEQVANLGGTPNPLSPEQSEPVPPQRSGPGGQALDEKSASADAY